MRKITAWLAAGLVAIAGLAVANHSATADEETPTVGPSVAGIHAPCPVAYPWPGDDASISSIKEQFGQNFGVTLAGSGWTDANRRQIQVMWQTLDAVSCTDFMADLKSKVSEQVGVNASSISGYAWGDWSLTMGGYVTFDFTKWKEALDAGDEGRISRLVIHEFTHVLNADRFANPTYWREFQALASRHGTFSDYAGSRVTETLPEVVGYYVARCAADNPYNTGKFDAYYEWVKTTVFDGREFGPAPGTVPTCDVTAEDLAPAPAPEETAPSVPEWVSALSGE